MKRIIKKIVMFVACQHALIHKIHLYFGANYKYKSIALAQKAGVYGVYLRQGWYKKTLKKCGSNLLVGYGSYIVYRSVEIGNNCAIEEYCVVSNCSIGDDVILAANVSIMSGAHHHPIDDLEIKFRDKVNPLGRVSLGNNLWIGTHAVVMADVNDGAIVAAGAIVTKPVLENSIVVGNPARHLRYRGGEVEERKHT